MILLKTTLIYALKIVITLVAVSLVVFVLGKVFVPGDSVTFIVGAEGGSPERIAELRQQFGLDRPLAVQYYLWISQLVQGEFGVSIVSGRAIAESVQSQAVVSLQLAVYATVSATILGVAAGVTAAWKAGSRVDDGIRTIMLVGYSVPVFLSGILALFVAARWGLGSLLRSYAPESDGLVPHVQSMLLPTLSIAIPVAAMFAQMTRSAILDTLSERYILFARARGIGTRRILLRHALRNALAPIVTLVAFQFGVMVGGLIVVEEVFSLPGLGRGLLIGIGQRDFPYMMTVTMLLAGVFVVVNGIADVLYPWIDPRQRQASL